MHSALDQLQERGTFLLLSLRLLVRSGVAFTALCVALWPLAIGHASGVFWLPTQQASDASFDHLNPVLVAYHNHAYILSVRVNGSSPVTSVFFTTNESGHWTSQRLSDKGPANTYSGEFVSLAVDATTGRLYALWLYQKNADEYAAGAWTRDSSGQWSGPTDIATAGFLGGQPSIVAANGRADAAFTSSNFSGACDDSTTRSGDIQVAAYNNGSWSPPQNLTSCVSDPGILSFDNPKLALDESGRVYLTSSANGDLWYDEKVSGSWSDPAPITHGVSIPESVGTALRTFYGIAASNGTAYVAYLRQIGTSTSDVVVVSRPVGGSWSAPIQVSSQDSHNCPKFGLSIVATAGRLGLSYARGHTGYCGSSTGIFENTPFVFAGTPEHLTAVGSLEGTSPDCFSTSLTTEGNLFHFVTSCDHPTSLGRGQLYYKSEFLDTVGPVSKLFAPARSKAPSIHLHWSAQDPHPGSGVALYQLQIREDSGSWRTLLASTHVKQLTYRHVQAGHRYTFRLRAQDRTANWGVWATAKTLSG